jgi:hypothetical protein
MKPTSTGSTTISAVLRVSIHDRANAYSRQGTRLKGGGSQLEGVAHKAAKFRQLSPAIVAVRYLRTRRKSSPPTIGGGRKVGLTLGLNLPDCEGTANVLACGRRMRSARSVIVDGSITRSRKDCVRHGTIHKR